ncbi:Crp/Fnr family transcriptional regulator [Christiangramia aquimixticola]|uniref:Crp/Fnr family transcriptional regulator n=1 Tax=Christiangramia aquimixticola TaxID=1697558 RepID=UPI003AA95CB5
MNSAELLYSNYEESLQKCELFAKLSKPQWFDLLADFHEETWTQETCIINQQKFLQHFYIITSGRIKMYNVDEISQKEHTLFLLKEGDVFDLFCLLDGAAHKVYYECIDNINVLGIHMDHLRTWLKKNPSHFESFFSYTGKIMRALEANVSELIFANISTRLLKLLLSNIDEESNKLRYINDLPNKELANLIGSTRAVVNRHLQILKKNGSIKLQRNKVQIKDLDLLIKELEKENNNSK